ncbi:MAG: Dyp-type peroxidase, partial [Ilumatobacter sp.]|nr:Dyp-type peroxidase [Ilumatobacter sp.]
MNTGTAAPGSGISRRRLLVGGAGLAGAGAAGALAVASLAGDDAAAQTAGGGVVPFHGVHQAGAVTPAQDRLYFASFDVITDDPGELHRLLDDWTVAAAQMTAGLEAGEYGAVGGPYLAPPEDTGEALGLPAANLTITV